MPHITMEYTANLRELAPDATLFHQVHQVLESVAGIRIANCKSRWHEIGEWLVGAGEPAGTAFVHLDVRFLEGRTEQVRQSVGRALLQILEDQFAPVPDGLDLQITVEIGEIRKADYFKYPPGTLAPGPLRKA